MKKTFEVEIKEISTRYIQVQADNADDARRLIIAKWHDNTKIKGYDKSFDCDIETVGIIE
jgi:hypothetical protein